MEILMTENEDGDLVFKQGGGKNILPPQKR